MAWLVQVVSVLYDLGGGIYGTGGGVKRWLICQRSWNKASCFGIRVDRGHLSVRRVVFIVGRVFFSQQPIH